MSGILTQDSISLTESLDGVRFCYLATSSRKAGTIGRSTKHPTQLKTKGADSFFLLSSEENWHRGGGALCRSSSPRCSKVDGQIQHYVTVTGHFVCVRGMKLKPHAFPCKEVLCHLSASPWNRCPHRHRVQNTLICWSTDSLQAFQEIRHLEKKWNKRAWKWLFLELCEILIKFEKWMQCAVNETIIGRVYSLSHVWATHSVLLPPS